MKQEKVSTSTFVAWALRQMGIEPCMGRGQTLSHTFPAVADSVPRAREALSTFARTAGASAEQLDSIRLAVSEAATNVVVHAYEDDPGRILLNAGLSAGELWVLIADDGLGMRPQIQSPGLGFGLSLMSQVCDDFEIAKRSSGGLEVRMRFALSDGRTDWMDGPGSSAMHFAETA
jgi:anti-sigma regulatory factor (Ser/Thr protein kinase)